MILISTIDDLFNVMLDFLYGVQGFALKNMDRQCSKHECHHAWADWWSAIRSIRLPEKDG